jgi:hypothetical protein
LPTPSEQLNQIFIDSHDIYDLLSNLDVSKAIGSDGISSKILKFCSLAIYDPITHVFNTSLGIQSFPQSGKYTKYAPSQKTETLQV